MCGRRRARIAVLKTLLERLLGWLLARFLYGYVGRSDFLGPPRMGILRQRRAL